MINFLTEIEQYKNRFFDFLILLNSSNKQFLIQGEILEIYRNSFDSKYKEENFDIIINSIQEVIIQGNSFFIDFRSQIATTDFYQINIEELTIEKIQITDYLKIKERYIDIDSALDIPTLNFKPFYDRAPSIRDIKNIGGGVEFLNKYLSSQMFNNIDSWKDVLFKFITMHKYQTTQLILNDRISDTEQLLDNISRLRRKFAQQEKNTIYSDVKYTMQDLGFEAGLGKDVGEIIKSLDLLENLLTAPDNVTLKEFLSRIPMIFNIAIISPHGYFAQRDVLGLPDTGGQVVYILDQIKALEKALIKSLKKAGLNILPKLIILTRLIPDSKGTTCSQKLEKVHETKNSWILRVPFRDSGNNIINHWISRFDVWPYLENFAEDSFYALKAEFNGGQPDLIIGNYSDGNLVSYLLSKKFNVTQCCIAHALEKSKYLFSDLYWQSLEDQYHFSMQFTADLIAMNSSDFQITSTYQEVAGTEFTVGQYETHKHFTLPGLYRVENGVNLSHIKFNIISPGVNERIYFPYFKQEKRIKNTQNYLRKLLFENIQDEDVVGKLDNPELRPIFSMARLDKNKNLVALAKWFGESAELREKCNLILVAGVVDVNKSTDKEEIEQINVMHNLIQEYNLYGKIRWIGKLFRKNEAGEVYRVIADKKGVFIQPGLFEGFGLTVLEAMISGLPVIATKYGGPLEIIQDKENGFHIDPINTEESIKTIIDVVNKFEDEKFWDKISKNSIKRVNEAYNWKLYSERLLTLSKIYGFWRYSADFQMTGLYEYLDILYHLLFKPRSKKLMEK